MTQVKICGLTSKEAALAAVESGADALGFVFTSSRREISPELAREIIRSLPPYITTTGVFVDTELSVLNRTAEYCGLDLLQLHGEESPDYCKAAVRPVVKTIHIRGTQDFGEVDKYIGVVRGFLLDTYIDGETGGTGRTFPWEIAVAFCRCFKEVNFILAGGLNPDNVADAISQTRPYAVDVSSGVETGGEKDPAKMRAFVQAVRSSLSSKV